MNPRVSNASYQMIAYNRSNNILKMFKTNTLKYHNYITKHFLLAIIRSALGTTVNVSILC